MTELRRMELRHATVTLEHGIVIARLRAGVSMTLDDAREAIATQQEIAGTHDRQCVLVDIRLMASVSGEARRHFASPAAGERTLALAMLISSPVSRVIGNFYLGLNKPLYPFRLFTDETEALAWLQAHRRGAVS